MILKTPEEIAVMAEGGRRLAEVLRRLKEATRAGTTTKYLDRLAYQLIHKSGAKPAFLHYRPAGARHAYPHSLCTSLNDVVVHGQPSDYAIKEGDLVKLDLGLLYKGFYLDAARTVAVGRVGKDAEQLVAATQEALRAAISETKIGKTLGDIGYTIEKIAKKNRCAVADGLTGHGIGRSLHEDPTVPNVGRTGEGEELQEGIVLAIEPMFVLGRPPLKQLRDESWATADGSLTAHFEHTVAVTKSGPQVLTA
jgi:methionyl aminopeptidase